MRDPAPTLIRLEDYTPPAWLVDTVDLDLDIHADHVVVDARLALRRNPEARGAAPVRLDGEELQLLSLAIDGRPLPPAALTVTADRLEFAAPADAFVLATRVRIDPWTNTRLMGLFRSRDGLFTQCEAEGFRRITWFPDRPDVMSRYTVTLHADATALPRLLSNGNLVASGAEPGGRHFARWEDPFPKPCYLFAAVAARLDLLEDHFTTRSGRRALLQVYVEPGKLDQAGYAMECLKRSMRWDEDTFGLELDLERFMIVAVGDFNMGAMENKGLNIFNTRYVLARPDTATDTDYLNIDRVVAHEYFHNWTGNRVTCRDWFQLSLKEGLTVFRDQEYGADVWSRAVQRIQEVRGLRAAQFAEDAGPMAHPVRPSAYMEISNFYTATVYEKGAEVVRMIHTLLGSQGFRRGMDLYFARHDGQAVTCEDFVKAMEDATGTDLTQFRRWYEQAGTPRLRVDTQWDPAAGSLTLEIVQSCPPTPGQPHKQPLHIPLAVGLVGEDGTDLPLRLEGEAQAQGTTRVLHLREPAQRFTFIGLSQRPVPSLARGFSAPVVLDWEADDDDLLRLMASDSDPFNRWEAGQKLAAELILRQVQRHQNGLALEVPTAFEAAMDQVLAGAAADPAFAAELLALPSEAWVGQLMEVWDPEAVHAVRRGLRGRLAETLKDRLWSTWRAMAVTGPYRPDPASAGRRALRNACLGLLMELEDDTVRAVCLAQWQGADNMTDAMAALTALAGTDCPERERALADFHGRWRHEALVLDKWFTAQATSRLPGTLEAVRALTRHADFDIRNPNRVRALVGSFCQGNPLHFHAADGGGYEFLAEHVLALDALNPQVAARLLRAMDRWRKFDAGRQACARTVLERIRDHVGLSRDATEVVLRLLD